MIRFALAFVFIVASLSAATVRNPMPGWMAPPGVSSDSINTRTLTVTGTATVDSLNADVANAGALRVTDKITMGNATYTDTGIVSSTIAGSYSINPGTAGTVYISAEPGNGQALVSDSINTRTISVKDRPYTDVTAFGAVGDSSTDNTAAIRAARDYVLSLDPPGGTLFFPCGVYMTDTIMLHTQRISWSAPPGCAKLIMRPGAVPADKYSIVRYTLYSTQDTLVPFVWENLGLDGNRQNLTGTFTVDQENLNLKGVRGGRITGLTSVNAPGDGLDLDSTQRVAVSASTFIGNGGNGVHNSLKSAANSFVGNIARSNGFVHNRSGFDSWGPPKGGQYTEYSVWDGNIAQDNYRNYEILGQNHAFGLSNMSAGGAQPDTVANLKLVNVTTNVGRVTAGVAEYRTVIGANGFSPYIGFNLMDSSGNWKYVRPSNTPATLISSQASKVRIGIARPGVGGSVVTWANDSALIVDSLGARSRYVTADSGLIGTLYPTTQQMGDSNITLSALTEYLQTTTTLTATRTVTLLAPSVYGHRCFEVQDFAGAINASNDIDIDPNGKNINGSTAVVTLSTQYASVKICSRPATDDFFIARQHP